VPNAAKGGFFMNSIINKIKSRFKTAARGRFLYIALIAAGIGLIGFSSYRLIATQLEYSSARSEYQELREIFSAMTVKPSFAQAQAPPGDGNGGAEAPEVPGAPGLLGPGIEDEELRMLLEMVAWEDPMQLMLDKNPDFVGWMTIDNLISYPLVQGQNNNRYLNTTFLGQRNSSGAIFMDYRNNSALSDPVTIIYGHNMRDGSMFRPLHRLRDSAILSDHQYITITTHDWEVFTYRIFAARTINVWDVENDPLEITGAAVFRSVRGAPGDAEQFLILSTCTDSADDDERLRIYAALID